MTRGVCAVQTEREFWCCEAVLVDRIFVSTSFGVAGMVSIMVEMRCLRCACVVFLTGRQSGCLEYHEQGYVTERGTWILVL